MTFAADRDGFRAVVKGRRSPSTFERLLGPSWNRAVIRFHIDENMLWTMPTATIILIRLPISSFYYNQN